MIKKPTLNQIRPFYQHLRQQAENKKLIKKVEIIATFSLIIIFLFLAIRPTAFAISTLIGEIKAKQLASQKMSAKINSVIQAQDSFSQVQEKYHLIESTFPTNPSFYQAAANFSSLSQQAAVDVNRLTFSVIDEEKLRNKKSKEDYVTYFKADLSINSSYQQALFLIQSLANNRRLIDLSSVHFSRSDEKNNDDQLPPGFINVNFSTNLFYSPINEKN